MRILLDTCTFLWIAQDAPQLSAVARDLYRDPTNEIYLSVVSAWEISVKYSLGRLPLPEPPAQFVPSRRKRYGLISLPVEEESAVHEPKLPKLHADPFDRLLVCQSIVHGAAVLTPDRAISQYPVRTLW